MGYRINIPLHGVARAGTASDQQLRRRLNSEPRFLKPLLLGAHRGARAKSWALRLLYAHQTTEKDTNPRGKLSAQA
jgi:hypothetical protein